MILYCRGWYFISEIQKSDRVGIPCDKSRMPEVPPSALQSGRVAAADAAVELVRYTRGELKPFFFQGCTLIDQATADRVCVPSEVTVFSV